MTDIIIADVFQAIEIVEKQPGFFQIISILNPDKKVDFPGEKVLCLRFHDAILNNLNHNEKILATEEDCRKALDFLSKEGKFLVHCASGKSQSTAIVLGYLLTQMDCRKAVEQLYKIRPNARPNTYIIQLMCNITDTSYNDVINAIALESF